VILFLLVIKVVNVHTKHFYCLCFPARTQCVRNVPINELVHSAIIRLTHLEGLQTESDVY